MKRFGLVAWPLLITLAGCADSGDPGERMSDADRAQARSLQAAYEAARVQHDWLGAEARADELRERFPDSDAEQAIGATLAEVRKQADAVRETQRLRDAWTYQVVAVEGGAQRTATLYSRTPPAEEGMPTITPDAQLVLRDHPAWGRSAYLLLAQKRFECGAPCAMRIAFDGGTPREFAGRQADSGKGPALFIEDDEGFIAALGTSRELKITLPQGSGAVPSLVFEVAGFAPSRYARP
jgi:hypothetical protein